MHKIPGRLQTLVNELADDYMATDVSVRLVATMSCGKTVEMEARRSFPLLADLVSPHTPRNLNDANPATRALGRGAQDGPGSLQDPFGVVEGLDEYPQY